MRKFFAFLLVAAIAASCTTEDPNPTNNTGQLVITASNASLSSGRVLTSNVSSLLVTIEDEAGNKILERAEIPATGFGDSFVTDPVFLNAGSYCITEFFVKDEANEISYAAPVAGSPNAEHVEQPLPICFQITKEATTNLSPEVLSTEDSTPLAFGYLTLGFEVVEPAKKLTFNFPLGEEKPDSVKITLRSDENTIEKAGTISNGGASAEFSDVPAGNYRVIAQTFTTPDVVAPYYFDLIGTLVHEYQFTLPLMAETNGNISLPPVTGHEWEQYQYAAWQHAGKKIEAKVPADACANYGEIFVDGDNAQWVYFDRFFAQKSNGGLYYQYAWHWEWYNDGDQNLKYFKPEFGTQNLCEELDEQSISWDYADTFTLVYTDSEYIGFLFVWNMDGSTVSVKTLSSEGIQDYDPMAAREKMTPEIFKGLKKAD